MGYALPPCNPGCPHLAQADRLDDHIVIYQQAYLHLWGGAPLVDADVVIIDESPLDALLEERHVAR